MERCGRKTSTAVVARQQGALAISPRNPPNRCSMIGINLGAFMPKAIFVSLAKLYPQLAVTTQGSAALRNCTCCWWRVNATNAAGVRYAFGVVGARIVSVYGVDVDIADWPTMPAKALGTGRRYIPVRALTQGEWSRAMSLKAPQMYGAVRYGDVVLDAQGGIVDFSAPSGGPTCDDEQEPDAPE